MATHSSIRVWETLYGRNLLGYSPWGYKSQTYLSLLSNNNNFLS